MNNEITEIKSTLEGTNSRITEAEERISEMEDRMVEINEAERKKELKEMRISELPPVNAVNTKGQFFRASFGKTPGSKYSSTSGLSPRGHLERQAELHASTQDEA